MSKRIQVTLRNNAEVSLIYRTPVFLSTYAEDMRKYRVTMHAKTICGFTLTQLPNDTRYFIITNADTNATRVFPLDLEECADGDMIELQMSTDDSGTPTLK